MYVFNRTNTKQKRRSLTTILLTGVLVFNLSSHAQAAWSTLRAGPVRITAHHSTDCMVLNKSDDYVLVSIKSSIRDEKGAESLKLAFMFIQPWAIGNLTLDWKTAGPDAFKTHFNSNEGQGPRYSDCTVGAEQGRRNIRATFCSSVDTNEECQNAIPVR